MARRGRSPSSTRIDAGSRRPPWGSPRARPSSVLSFHEARGSACPPCGEAAARRGRLDSPAPAYKLHDLTERLVAIRRAEHGAGVFTAAEEHELLRRARGGEAGEDVRRRAQRVAVGADKQLPPGDLLRELVRHGGDGSGD